MLKISVFLVLGIVTCYGDVTTPQPIRCGYIPDNLYKCLGNPQVVKNDVSAQCTKSISECERMKCIFAKSGWMDGDKINKQKVKNHFDQFAKDHPVWAEEVANVKNVCLTGDLPMQGVYQNCPAYDVISCALTSFVKNAHPSQWSSSSECEYARQFASACPLCPSDCFAPLIPNGSCNACLLLPRSA